MISSILSSALSAAASKIAVSFVSGAVVHSLYQKFVAKMQAAKSKVVADAKLVEGSVKNDLKKL